MTTVLYSDNDYPDAALESALFRAAGVELRLGQCESEDDVIAQGDGCDAILTQYAPVTARVLDALPSVGLVSRIGAGYDNVDTEACAKRGVWVANSPDYGVAEVATHALALALALVRHLPAFDRKVREGEWHYLSTGRISRGSSLTLGILGLGRIGRRMSELSRACFGGIIAC